MRSAMRNGPRAFACRRTRQREAERFERRLHLGLDVAGKLARAVGVLAFGRDRDPARKIGLERAGVEIARGARDGIVSAHGYASGRPATCQVNMSLSRSPPPPFG